MLPTRRARRQAHATRLTATWPLQDRYLGVEQEHLELHHVRVAVEVRAVPQEREELGRARHVEVDVEHDGEVCAAKGTPSTPPHHMKPPHTTCMPRITTRMRTQESQHTHVVAASRERERNKTTGKRGAGARRAKRPTSWSGRESAAP